MLRKLGGTGTPFRTLKANPCAWPGAWYGSWPTITTRTFSGAKSASRQKCLLLGEDFFASAPQFVFVEKKSHVRLLHFLSRMGRHEGAILNSRSTSSHELWQLVVKSGCVDTLVLMRATPCGSPQGLLRFGGGAPVSPGAGETTHAGPISLVGVELFDPFSSGVVSGMFT